MNLKNCTGPCGRILPATTEYFYEYFYKREDGQRGLRSQCKECHKQYREANYDKIRIYIKQYQKDNPAKKMLITTKNRAKRKKLEFDLTENWVQERLDKGICEVTGLKFEYTDGYRRPPFTPSIDRIDNNKGYTKDNCRMVIWAFNAGKSEYDIETTYKWCKAFVEKFKEKNIVVERKEAEG